MAIAEQQTYISYVATGEKKFVIPFTYLEKDNVKVFVAPPKTLEKVELTKGIDFSVEDNYVILKQVEIDSTVFIQRETKAVNENNFTNNTKLSAEVLNHSFDRLTMICQELEEKLSRAFTYDIDENIDPETLVPLLLDFQKHLQTAEQLSLSVLKAAVSAAQALTSALDAKRYRDEAENIVFSASADSTIPAHNISEEAHQYIQNLIGNVREALNKHIENYNTLAKDFEDLKDNSDYSNESFADDLKNLDDRLIYLENKAQAGKGNTYYGFGYNNNGQLGMNGTSNIADEPLANVALNAVTKVSLSQKCGGAISGGRIYVTGAGENCFTGPAEKTLHGFSTLVDNIYDFVDIAVSNETGFALDKDGKLFSWGNAADSCLGDGSAVARAEIRRIMPDVKFKAVAAGAGVMLALAEDGTVYSCGSSRYGALGQGSNSETNSQLTQIVGLDNITAVSCGGVLSSSNMNFCAALQQKANEPVAVFLWGHNSYGQLGTNDITSYAEPQLINVPCEIQKVVCGSSHTAVLSTDGKVFVSGNKKALLANDNVLSFTHVAADISFTDIAAGIDVTYCLGTDKQLYAFGTATYGSMLDNQSSAVPVKIYDKTVEQIFSNCSHYGCVFSRKDS